MWGIPKGCIAVIVPMLLRVYGLGFSGAVQG